MSKNKKDISVKDFNDGSISAIQSQVVTELSKDELFAIPWGHHRKIISAYLQKQKQCPCKICGKCLK